MRSTLYIKPGETVSPNDDRLALVVQWMESSPGARDLFEIWENMNQVRVIPNPSIRYVNVLHALVV